MRDVNLTWYVGLDADGTKIGNALWNGEEIDEIERSRVVGLFRLSFRDPDIVIEKVGKEPVYPYPRHERGQDSAHEAAEFRHRPADPASRGGDMSALKTIPVGIIVERRKAASQWIDYMWRPASAGGVPQTAAVDDPVARRRRDHVLCRRCDDRIVQERDRRNIATISPAIIRSWVVLRPTESDPPYSLLAVTADPSEGEAFSETGDRSCGSRSDAGQCARGDDRLRRRASCRAAILQAANAIAPIPKRWRGATR